MTSLSAIHSASLPGVPISSAVGTWSSAPRNKGVKTVQARSHREISHDHGFVPGDGDHHLLSRWMGSCAIPLNIVNLASGPNWNLSLIQGKK